MENLIKECSEEDRREREQHWINKLDCVNINKLNYDPREYKVKHRERTNELQTQRRKLKD